jgi:hypothetical protein
MGGERFGRFAVGIVPGGQLATPLPRGGECRGPEPSIQRHQRSLQGPSRANLLRIKQAMTATYQGALATLLFGIYSGHRCQMALGCITPQECLQRLLIAE